MEGFWLGFPVLGTACSVLTDRGQRRFCLRTKTVASRVFGGERLLTRPLQQLQGRTEGTVVLHDPDADRDCQWYPICGFE